MDKNTPTEQLRDQLGYEIEHCARMYQLSLERQATRQKENKN